MHAAHGRTHYQAQMLYAELVEETLLRQNHIAVFVMREARVQTVARLARLTVPDVVGKNDVVFFGIQQLAGAEELIGKPRVQESAAGSAGAVQDQYRVVALKSADGRVVQAQLVQLFAAGEAEVLEDYIAFRSRKGGVSE